MASQTVSRAERIRELSSINTDVAAMLHSAGLAISALTNRPYNPSSDEDTQMTDDASNTVDAHQSAFTEHTQAYFTNMQAVFARLRRQAYALEEAGIITADSTAVSSAPTRTQQGVGGLPKAETERIKNGGLGNFDIGWLNSRGNKVGEEKEAELLQEAKQLLEERLNNKKG